jgi:hypothetical protein
LIETIKISFMIKENVDVTKTKWCSPVNLFHALFYYNSVSFQTECTVVKNIPSPKTDMISI